MPTDVRGGLPDVIAPTLLNGFIANGASRCQKETGDGVTDGRAFHRSTDWFVLSMCVK
jgi:hypothetical protein